MRFTFLALLCVGTAAAQPHYKVKLTADLNRQLLRGEETIEFFHQAGTVDFQKQPGLRIIGSAVADGEVTEKDDLISVQLRTGGTHLLKLNYSVGPTHGLKWFEHQAGFDTAFYCEAWMVCDNTPNQRATMVLEIVVPAPSGLKAVGPGRFKKQWRDSEGEHFLFEQAQPVQTYLFSFGVAKLSRSIKGRFVLLVLDNAPHENAIRKTADAYAFFRSKAGVDLDAPYYTQASMPDNIEQEAAGMALMPSDFLVDLEEKDDPSLMSHELAHQWWGVMVGIRSWSDFWLNEGFADFMMDAYLERCKGRGAYDSQMAAARQRLAELKAQGHDRPLHWEGWRNSQEALGRIPYVKGALLLDHLRALLGEDKFWSGIALYTKRNLGRLVDSQDFERAMEDASGRDLKLLFDAEVYH